MSENTGTFDTLRICKRCIYSEIVPRISFDPDGICNYCKLMDELIRQYGTGMKKGEEQFKKIVDKIKKAGRNKKYDCIIGVSGGTDSSYLVYKAIGWGLRPLAVHYDNTWNSAIATQNIRTVLTKLDVDLYTYVVDNKEMDDIFKSFFRASVPDLDSPTDIAIAEVMYRVANKYGIKYILEGHSFMTEGISPLGTLYIDGKYIHTVQEIFGEYRIKTFPNMRLLSFLKWIIVKRIKKIRPFWYMKYSKKGARKLLETEFGWEYYGGHHLENRMTAFHHSYYNPNKFNSDSRNNSIAAAVRSGQISREDAVNEYYFQEPYLPPGLLKYFKKRLNLTDDEFAEIMNLPKKSYRDYKTYKRTFERLRPLFYLMYKMHLVPQSFFIKYTSENEV